jgi:hypothetical protein
VQESWYQVSLYINIRRHDCCVDKLPSIGAADFKLALHGHFFNLGDENSRNPLPDTLYATRHGLETLLRRLVVGNGQYHNIEQVVGTVTGIIPSVNDPTSLQGVSVRTGNGDKTLPATLVIGS